MASSDGSFGWSDTSNSIMLSDDDCASIASSVLDRKANKKKLKKVIREIEDRRNSQTVTQNGHHESEDQSVERKAKKKKKNKKEKSSIFETNHENAINEPIDNIKCEPMFSLEVKHKKKIKSEPNENSTTEILTAKNLKNKNKHNSKQHDEDITDGQVKREETDLFSKKKKRKRKHSTEQNITDEIIDDTFVPPTNKKHKKNKNKSVDKTNVALNVNISEDLICDEIDHQKKNKQKISFSNNTECSTEDNNFDQAETTNSFHTPKQRKQEKALPLKNRSPSSSSSSSVGHNHSSSSKNMRIRNESSHSSSSDDQRPESTSRRKSTGSTMDKPNMTNFRKSFPLSTIEGNKRSSFSERIQFEDELNIPHHSENKHHESGRNLAVPKKIEKFMERNPQLKSVSCIGKNESIGKDDDVWIIKCPTDFNHDSLKNMVVSIEDKIKIKLDGQTFDGVLEEEINRTAVLLPTNKNSGFEIRDICPKGTLTFRKRIPKVNIDTANIVIPHETFIPLPETKQRHPLFGPDYRKRIKIPAAVAERLADDTPRKKLKSKRKHKDKSEPELCTKATEDSSVQDEVDNSIKKKKKRKRKHSEMVSEESVAKKFKRDPEYWDSEKAIENSLFNF